LLPTFVTWMVPPENAPVTSVEPVASEKLPPVIVAVGVQERQRAVCRTSAFQDPGSAPEAVPANLPSVEVK
jgi:hypothetical protein